MHRRSERDIVERLPIAFARHGACDVMNNVIGPRRGPSAASQAEEKRELHRLQLIALSWKDESAGQVRRNEDHEHHRKQDQAVPHRYVEH